MTTNPSVEYVISKHQSLAVPREFKITLRIDKGITLLLQILQTGQESQQQFQYQVKPIVPTIAPIEVCTMKKR